MPITEKNCRPAVPKRKPALLSFILRRKPGMDHTHGLLDLGFMVLACRIGRSGVSTRKREGDGATPAARMAILGGYRNPARFGPRQGCGQLRPASPRIGWCDAPSHPAYNRPVKLPFRSGHESMIRTERQYDICLVLDWNIHPRSRNRGSAIFLHQTEEPSRPTAGCVALDPDDMRRLLPRLLVAGRRHILVRP